MWTATGNPGISEPIPQHGTETCKGTEETVRKKPGSRRYEEQRRKVAKLHAKSKHQRSDFLHKLSCFLTDTYDLIAIENNAYLDIRRNQIACRNDCHTL